MLPIYLILILGISYPAYGQPCNHNKIDSLIQQTISGKIEITEKINLWNEIAKCYLDINLDSTAYYAEKAKYLSTEMGYKKGMAVSILYLAKIEKTHGHYDQAVPMFKNVIELYDGLDKDPNYLQAINLIGIIYEMQQDFDKSIDYYLIGLREAELQGQKLFIAYFHNNISIIYGYTGFQDKKLIHIKKASEMFKELGHDDYYANSLLNIGIYYKRLKEFDTAFVYFFEAEKLQKKNNNYYGLTNLYHNFGDISLEKNQLEDALNYYQKSLEYAIMLDSFDPDRRSLISLANLNIGNAFLKLGRFSLAKDYFYKAYSEGRFLKSMFQQIGSSYGLFTSFLGLEQNDSAMYYHNIFLALNDSLLAETYNEKIDKLNYDYKLEKEKELLEKDKDLITLQKNRQELIYLIIVGILFIIATAIFIIWYFQKTKLQKSELIRENLRLEKENISNDLDKKNRELTTNVLNLIERNEFIAKLSEQLENHASLNDPVNSDNIAEIIRSIDQDTTNNLWKEFELRYMEVHKDFHQKLTTNYPQLTANERKLCAFMVLNMSTKDISSITYQSEHSIKIARYRLRKKLGLSKNENLTAFLHNL
ncbi:MAG: hypothetical protein J7L04_12990 [Bacteroidales bacterium]|nr:hypothetical protein [Bacteroidales bacterium]